jgi:mRNA-degrading endonuclease RelE of RelBE toxin-antitoxin system
VPDISRRKSKKYNFKYNAHLLKYKELHRVLYNIQYDLTVLLEKIDDSKVWNDFLDEYDDIKQKFDFLQAQREKIEDYEEKFLTLKQGIFSSHKLQHWIEYHKARIRERYKDFDDFGEYEDYAKFEDPFESSEYPFPPRSQHEAEKSDHSPRAIRLDDYYTADPLTVKTDEESKWISVITPSFKKAIKKIKGPDSRRIHHAIEAIIKSPMSFHGETSKPLGNNKKGLWRYRVGDKRIIYEPNSEYKQVRLLDICNRDKAYA